VYKQYNSNDYQGQETKKSVMFNKADNNNDDDDDNNNNNNNGR
jgi:hypothetical protein